MSNGFFCGAKLIYFSMRHTKRFPVAAPGFVRRGVRRHSLSLSNAPRQTKHLRVKIIEGMEGSKGRIA
jgi:hypothetical protein